MKFVHMPTERTHLIPVGMIPLANLVKSRGYDVELIHYGIDPIDLSSEETVLFDLHWHDQTAVVIDKCKEISCKKILGGFTATYYAEEIMLNYPVDYVIEGYAESQLLEILGSKLGHIHVDINDLEYSNFSILRNYEEYLKDKIFVFTPGRGCPVNCTYCGGGSQMQEKCGLNGHIFLKHEKVIQELKNSLKYGIETWLVNFDPKPHSDYYLKLFDMIDFDIKCQFDCWGLPTVKFIDKFAETFDDGLITISPRIGNEELRFRHKGMPFTDDHLYTTLDYLQSKGIKYKIYLASNFPGDDIQEMVDYIGEENCGIGDIRWEPGAENYSIPSFRALYITYKARQNFD